MKKRSRYRPKGVRVDNMSWLKQGMTTLVAAAEATGLKIKNYDALNTLRQGCGGFNEIDAVARALNIADALARGGEIGLEYAEEIRAGQDALLAMAQRGYDNGGRFVFTGPELTAVNLAMEIHDAQLDICTIADIETAVQTVKALHRAGRSRGITVSAQPST